MKYLKHIELFEDSQNDVEESNFSKILNILALKMGEYIVKEIFQSTELTKIYNWFVWDTDEASEVYMSKPYGTHVNFDKECAEDVDFYGSFPKRYNEKSKNWTIVWEVKHELEFLDKEVEKKFKERKLVVADKYLHDDGYNKCWLLMIEYPISDYFEANNQIFKEINT